MEVLKSELKLSYGYLFDEKLLGLIAQVGQEKKVKQGNVLISYGQPILYMPLLLQGAIKISRLDENEEELLLYFLESGDTCAMTMNCCIGNSTSKIQAVAEQDTHLIMIPVQYMDQWIKDFPAWRAFVFESYNNRFNEMLEAIDNLAFKNMHERLVKYLNDKVIVSKSEMLEATHQEIAYDLHTSRVVVSRLLKSLEKEGSIKLYRNKIEVLTF